MNERHRDPTRSFYDRISHVYDLLADAGEHGAREEGVEALEVAEGERALEIGYGTGHALVELARAVGDEGRVVGIDISGGMADIARKRVDQAGLIERVRIDRGDVRDLPYEDGAFDIVFCSFTLELFEDDERPRVLAEIRRVLRPGGAPASSRWRSRSTGGPRSSCTSGSTATSRTSSTAARSTPPPTSRPPASGWSRARIARSRRFPWRC